MRNPVVGLAIVGLGASLGPLDIAVNVALPAITSHFRLPLLLRVSDNRVEPLPESEVREKYRHGDHITIHIQPDPAETVIGEWIGTILA